MSSDQTIPPIIKPLSASAQIDDISIEGYSLKRFIARGGMASVYLARQLALGRDVALKIIDKSEDEHFVERFLNEGRLVASMSHPNVITIYDLGVLDDGRAYLSMEFIDGGDLESRLKRPFSEVQVFAVVKELLACLAYVHSHDVIHRDIKPANILFRKDGTLVLTDFGIARNTQQDDLKTEEGLAVGSPGYMSPEQAQAHRVDARTDLYSVGVILSQLLLGKNEFSATSNLQTSMNHIQMAIPSLPMAICQYQIVLNKLLAKDPHKRFTDANKALRFIEQLPEVEDRLLPINTHDTANIAESFHTDVYDANTAMNTASSYSNIGTYISSAIFISVFAFSLWQFRLNIVPPEYLPKPDQARLIVIKANVAFQADQLLLPKDNSAAFFYQQALNLDPSSKEAAMGMKNIADRYASLAKQSIKAKKLAKAAIFIQRGLSIDQDHRLLTQLQKQYRL